MTHHPGMSIHPTALVDGRASIGRNVSIGAFTIVHGNVEIGDDTVIESHCEIGHPAACSDGTVLRIGERSLIRSHTVMYEGSSFGAELVTGHGTLIRDGTRAGLNLVIGTRGDIQGDCVIGDYVRTQTSVAIGKGSIIGSFVWMFPRVSILNDPMPPSSIIESARVDDFAVICSHSIVMPGVTVGEGAFVGVNSVVARSIPGHQIGCGDPLQLKGPTSRLRLPGTRQPARPWPNHFSRGYPEGVLHDWERQVLHLAA